MDRKLRHLIARSGTARLALHFLTKAIGVNQFIGADGDRVQSVQEPKLPQFANRMRQRIDADPKLADRIIFSWQPGLVDRWLADRAGAPR